MRHMRHMRHKLLTVSFVLVFALMFGVPSVAHSQGAYANWEQLFKETEELISSDEFNRALDVGKEALQVAEKNFGPDHLNVALSLNMLAYICFMLEELEPAAHLSERAVAIYEKALGPNHPDVAENLYKLADLYAFQDEYAKAEPLYKRALAIYEKAFGPDNTNVVETLNALANVYSSESSSQRDYAKAEPLYKRVLVIKEKEFGPDHPDLAPFLINLANTNFGQKEYAKAEPLFKRALSIQEKALGADHAEVAKLRNNLATIYKELGDKKHYAEFKKLDIPKHKIISNSKLEYDFLIKFYNDNKEFIDSIENSFVNASWYDNAATSMGIDEQKERRYIRKIQQFGNVLLLTGFYKKKNLLLNVFFICKDINGKIKISSIFHSYGEYHTGGFEAGLPYWFE